MRDGKSATFMCLSFPAQTKTPPAGNPAAFTCNKANQPTVEAASKHRQALKNHFLIEPLCVCGFVCVFGSRMEGKNKKARSYVSFNNKKGFFSPYWINFVETPKTNALSTVVDYQLA